MKPIEIKPAMGGRLMSNVSAESVGIANYTDKKNWRRHMEREIRSEGFDWFFPNPESWPISDAHLSGVTDPITMVAMVKQPNGRIAVVAGTATTLYRYYGLDDLRYVADGYVAGGYIETPDNWIIIKEGLSASGNRWEAVSINGWLVLNNGADLPLTYRVQDLTAKPVYELRENGIASIGTIASHNGILHCMDVRQIEDGRLNRLLSAVPLAAHKGQAGIAGSGSIRAVINSGVAGVAGKKITCFPDYSGPKNLVPVDGSPLYSDGQLFIAASAPNAIPTGTVYAGANSDKDTASFLVPGSYYQYTPGINEHNIADTSVLNFAQLYDPSVGVLVGIPPGSQFKFPSTIGTTLEVGGSHVPGAPVTAILTKCGFSGMSAGDKIRMQNGQVVTLSTIQSSTSTTVVETVLTEPNQPFYFPQSSRSEFSVPMDFSADIIASCNTSALTTAQVALATALTSLNAASASYAALFAVYTILQSAHDGDAGSTSTEKALAAAQTALIFNPNNTALLSAIAAANAALTGNPSPTSADVAAALAASNAASGVMETQQLAYSAANLALQSAQASPFTNSDTDVASYLTDRSKVIGLKLYWDSGEIRTIMGWNAGNTAVMVDSDLPIDSGQVSLENPLAYAPFSDESYLQRYQARDFTGMPDYPRRWGSIVPVTINPTSNLIIFKRPAKSIEELSGKDFLILGAGTGGTNLQATSLFVQSNKLVVSGDITTAAQLITGALIQAQSDYADALSIRDSIASTLAAAKSSLVSSQANLISAIPDFDALSNAVTTAQEALDVAAQSQQAAAANVSSAQITLAEAQSASQAAPSDPSLAAAVIVATQAVTAAQQVFQNASVTYSVAQTELLSAQAKLSANPKSSELIAAVTSATAQVESSTNSLVTANVNLTAANAKLTAAQAATVPVDSEIKAADADQVGITFEDLQDDGSPILKALELKNVLVIYKGGPAIYIASYTSDPAQPYSYTKITIPENMALAFRNTLISVKSAHPLYKWNSSAHVYAGRDAFFSFDLITQMPSEVEPLQMCQDKFFQSAPDPEWAFVCDNEVTRELFIRANTDTDTETLRLDYRFGTLSTTDVDLLCGATVFKPVSDHRYSDRWFLMGTRNGTILRYGRTSERIRKSGSVTVSVLVQPFVKNTLYLVYQNPNGYQSGIPGDMANQFSAGIFVKEWIKVTGVGTNSGWS